MTPAAARGCTADIVIEQVDSAHCRAAIDALAESLLAASPLVDTGADDPGEGVVTRAHKALFVEVPHGSRGATFGDKLIAAANRQGLRARIGIADDRFTAWCAAFHRPATATAETDGSALFSQACTTVPRGGSAAFLASLPLKLLPLSNEVSAVLESLRVRTIGDFANLPAPTINRRQARWTDNGVDVHELANGAGPSALRRYVPAATLREELALSEAVLELEPVAFLLHPVVDRIAERLRGRGRAASGVSVLLAGDGTSTTMRIALPGPTSSGRAMLDAIRQRVIATKLDHAVESIAVEVIADTEPEVDELELFAARPHRRTRRGKRNRRRSLQQVLPLALD